ncbi:phosphotransferase [Streptomyces coeruleorubidus]|uniref:phosphotransferase n=1 Tax=Streptomyces coeruleorubidus TaxID=116188 RepID=UPI003799D517
MGHAVRRRAAAQGAHLAPLARPAPAVADPRPAAPHRALRALPRPWIVTTWVQGEPADRAPATRPAESAEALAAFLTALHRPAPHDAPLGRGRGDPLSDSAESFAEHLASATELGLLPDTEAVHAGCADRAGPSIPACPICRCYPGVRF